MRCEIIVDKEVDECVLIYAKEHCTTADKIKAFVDALEKYEIIGYCGKEMWVIDPAEVTCFVIEDGKVIAITDRDRWQLRERLYQIEEVLDNDFVKLNQSCIANIKKIKAFDATLSGSLTVKFKNGYRDYVSRRQMKEVKERIGLKK